MAGLLHIVATPIGNLEDISLRALKVLKESDLILAEDTRKSSILLKHYDIDKPILSYHQHSGEQRKLEILNHLLGGKNISLITDAGTPGISDPGNELISFLFSYIPDLKIIPIPGPTALTTALSISGFDVNKFVFLGFMPKKKRKKLFDWLKEGKISFAFYESPKRLLRTLQTLEHAFGKHIKIFIARELTKKFESTYKGSIREIYGFLENENIKGELVVVVDI